MLDTVFTEIVARTGKQSLLYMCLRKWNLQKIWGFEKVCWCVKMFYFFVFKMASISFNSVSLKAIFERH